MQAVGRPKSRLKHFVVIFLFLIFTTKVNSQYQKGDEKAQDDGVFGKIKNGLQMAGKLLGLDAASGVASLVAEGFSRRSHHQPPRGDHSGDESWGSRILSGIMRTLSLDSAKVSAIVINAIVFLAQLITTSLVPKNPALPAEGRRKIRDGTPIEWILENPSRPLQALIATSQDRELPDRVIETMKRHSEGTDTSCVQLLICKTAPFVWAMQRAMAALGPKFDNASKMADGKERANRKNGGNAFFRYLPEAREFSEHGDVCEQKYDECRLID